MINRKFKSNYEWAIPHIDLLLAKKNKKINIIAEIGSRDGLDGIFLSKKYNTKTYIFEPDPNNIPICKKNISVHKNKSQNNPRIYFFNFALSNKSSLINFYSVDPDVYDNPGASSMFLINFKNRTFFDPDRNRDCIQKKLKVQAKRFDQCNLTSPQMICMDAQGAELNILKGFGDKLKKCNFIITECGFNSSYTGGSNFKEIDSYLQKKGFIFYRSSITNETKPAPSLKDIFGIHTPEFDVLYINSKLK
jgi:FkbM family methyltransferase